MTVEYLYLNTWRLGQVFEEPKNKRKYVCIGGVFETSLQIWLDSLNYKKLS
jgi:hypothetical protein